MADLNKLKATRRSRRKTRVRKKVRGTPQCLRLTVFRSHEHVYAQLVDDVAERTVCAASTRDRRLRASIGYGGNQAAARAVGTALGEQAMQMGIHEVVFDRNGYRYHGRIKALADAAREAGLKF